jgi:putative MATE family efflux protein
MKDLTQGPVLRQLLGLTAFLVIAMLVQSLYSMVDLYFVGRLGARAQAAVTLSGHLMLISMALSQMLGVGTGALVAQAVGRKDHAHAHHVFNQALGLGLVMSLLFLAAAYAGQGIYSRTFSADAQTARLSGAYLRWFIPAMSLQFPMTAMSTALRGTGNMRPGTAASVGSLLLNIVLAPLLILGLAGAPALGVEGAGLATFISVCAGTAGLWLYFLRPQTFLRLQPRDWRPQRASWSAILRIGLPSGVEFGLLACYLLFVTATLRPFGAEQQAAFGIGQRLLQAGMLPVMALSFGAAALAGQNYGAGLAARVRETFAAALKLGLACTVCMWMLAQLVPALLIGVFSADAAVVAGGVQFLRVISFNLPPMAVAFACFGVLSGLGNTIPTLISSATRIGLIVLPATWLSSRPGFQPVEVWELSVAATVVQTLMNLWFLRRELNRKLGPAVAVGAAEPTP